MAKTRLTRRVAYLLSELAAVTLAKTRLTRRVAYIVGIGGGDAGQDKVSQGGCFQSEIGDGGAGQEKVDT